MKKKVRVIKMLSIYCDYIESECFDFYNCLKCKWKPADMIPESDCKRIEEDARFAIDSLEGLIACSPHIHQDYLKEKLSRIRRCIEFMQNFEKE